MQGVDLTALEPTKWVAAWKELSTSSQVVAYVFVAGVFFAFAGAGLAKVIRAVRGK